MTVIFISSLKINDESDVVIFFRKERYWFCEYGFFKLCTSVKERNVIAYSDRYTGSSPCSR